MKNIRNFVFPFSRSRRPAGQKDARKTRGQSLVEIAIAFPVLIMMLAGLVEFGFMLNYYLSLLDATREAARVFSSFDPFEDGFKAGNCMCSVSVCPDEAAEDRLDANCDRNSFYQGAAAMVIENLQPHGSTPEERRLDSSRRIILNASTDDVVVSVFSISDGSIQHRYPASGEYRWFNNADTRLTNEAIANRLVSAAPDTGILLVEVFFDYHQVLALPWLAPFLPDPVLLHAYTIMPLAAAEPKTPSP
ncbi:MAG: pilus assembly protein [Anaerolineae bacterium]|nr:pilus assembly protein [Anaerolineae bacterium]